MLRQEPVVDVPSLGASPVLIEAVGDLGDLLLAGHGKHLLTAYRPGAGVIRRGEEPRFSTISLLVLVLVRLS
jgi:hypothetical protein